MAAKLVWFEALLYSERWRGMNGNEGLRATHDYPLIILSVDLLRASSCSSEVFVFWLVPVFNLSVAYQSRRSSLVDVLSMGGKFVCLDFLLSCTVIKFRTIQ